MCADYWPEQVDLLPSYPQPAPLHKFAMACLSWVQFIFVAGELTKKIKTEGDGLDLMGYVEVGGCQRLKSCPAGGFLPCCGEPMP